MKRILWAVIISVICAVDAALFAPAAICSDDSVPESEATAREQKLGRETQEAIAKHFDIIHDPARQARVEMIVSRLRPFMERELDYQVNIIEHEMINAFSIAAGGMYVSTGMLDFVRTDLELAAVIAHEMVHADRRHVILQLAKNDRMTFWAVLAAVATRGHAAAIVAANALQVAIMGSYSIELEKEADSRGIDALRAAGYDPVGMLTLQERMREEEMHRPQIDMGIYQTHPDSKERIAAAERYMIDNGISIDRKRSLGLLRTKITTENGRISLTIDGTELISAPESDDAAVWLSDVAQDITRYLKLETAPFDIRVVGGGDGRSLVIVGKTLIRARDLDDPDDIDRLRDILIEVLSTARRMHPLADYFK